MTFLAVQPPPPNGGITTVSRVGCGAAIQSVGLVRLAAIMQDGLPGCSYQNSTASNAFFMAARPWVVSPKGVL